MDLKTSLLVNRQLPEFVREEYPLFVSFLEAYYEFLETERYTTVDGKVISQKNNLIEKLKDLQNFFDVDLSLDDFEEQFFNTFISYLPKQTLVDKSFLIKNILPLYQSKGTQKSFEYLFRLLYGEDIQIEYPGQKVLRASSGKWVIENILRADLEFYSQYISDGTNKIINLPYEMDSEDIEIKVNDVIFSNYYVRKELKKIYFNVTLPTNSVIKIYYKQNIFDTSIFNSKQIIGKTSNSKSIVEKVYRRNIAETNFYEFFINQKNTTLSFVNGELFDINVALDDGIIIPFTFQSLADVQSIQVINQGSNYKTGDPVILRGSSLERATAVVSDVSTGNIDFLNVKIDNYGAGYKINDNVFAVGYSTSVFSGYIDSIDSSGTISPNTFTYNTDLIDDFLLTSLSSSDFGFLKPGVENINTVISQALTFNTITNLGPATNVFVTISQISNNLNVEFLANSTTLHDDSKLSAYNSIGTIKVLNGGSGYSVGDPVIFTNTEYFSGQGASAFVSSVSPTGEILSVTVTSGGFYYDKNYLPILSVNSLGIGANLVVQHFMGQDVEFEYEIGDGIPGKILDISTIYPGKGYRSVPFVDLTLSGDGNATANANINSSIVKLPGRWITEDGFLSSDEIRLQGKDYYIDFSYVINSKIQFQNYKDVIRQLLNPVGVANYSRFLTADNIDVNSLLIVDDLFTRQLAGNVSVEANSIIILGGENVYFEVANTINLIREGTTILVNSELRIVNSVINNTTITVSEPFNYSSNDQISTIVTLPYNAITTEYWRELAIRIEGPRTLVITTEQ
jgi:hypothetical protein